MELLSDEESEPKSILEELAEQGHDSWWDRQKVLRSTYLNIWKSIHFPWS